MLHRSPPRAERRRRSRACRRFVCVWVLATASTAAVHNASAQVSQEAQAQTRFQRGRELFLARDWSGALNEFRAAYQLFASPNTRLYIARCLRELNRNAEAYSEFQRAAAEASDRSASDPRYATTRDNARNEAETVRGRVGRLTLRIADAPAGTTIRVAGTPIAEPSWNVALPFDPGRVEIHAVAPGRLAFRRETTVVAGQDGEITIEFVVDPEANRTNTSAGANGAGANGATAPNQVAGQDPERATPIGSAQPAMVRVTQGGGVRWIGIPVAAVGLGGGIAFAAFGTLAMSRFNDLEMACMGAPCTPALQSQVGEGEQYQTLANVSLVMGLVGIAAGVTMIAVGGPTTTERPATSTAAALRDRVRDAARLTVPTLGPLVMSTPQGTTVLGVRGAF